MRRLGDDATALILARGEVRASRDLHYPHLQDSDFLYLTGFSEPDAALMLSTRGNNARSILFLRERDPKREIWDGPMLGSRRARSIFEVDEVVTYDKLDDYVRVFLPGCCRLYLNWGVVPRMDSFVNRLLSESVHPSAAFPSTVIDIRELTAELRLVKSSAEIKQLRDICRLSCHAFMEFAKHIGGYTSERHAASVLEAEFYKRGADALAFNTIVGVGSNSTILHHTPQPLASSSESGNPKSSISMSGRFALVDAGARKNGYCADITRVFPVGTKTFDAPVAAVYDAVEEALSKCVSSVKPGVTLKQLRDIAVASLRHSLRKLGVIQAKTDRPHLNIRQTSGAMDDENKVVNKYFPHGIGHFLGLDVHDICPHLSGDASGGKTIPLRPGMVITLEPGLYFPLSDKSLPQKFRGIGIRLEQDVLIKPTGCEVLTDILPVKRTQVEDMF